MTKDKQAALIQRILKILAIEGLTIRELADRLSMDNDLIRRIVNKMYADGLVIVIGYKMISRNQTAIFAPWSDGVNDLGIVNKAARPPFDPTRKIICYGIWGM